MSSLIYGRGGNFGRPFQGKSLETTVFQGFFATPFLSIDLNSRTTEYLHRRQTSYKKLIYRFLFSTFWDSRLENDKYNIFGKLSDNQFIKLPSCYKKELEQVKFVVETLNTEVNQQEANVRKLVSVVKKYTHASA